MTNRISQPLVRRPGHPRKGDMTGQKTPANSLEDSEDKVHCLLAETEAFLVTQLTETINQAIAPIKALVTTLQATLSGRVRDVEDRLNQIIDNIDNTIKDQKLTKPLKSLWRLPSKRG